MQQLSTLAHLVKRGKEFLIWEMSTLLYVVLYVVVCFRMPPKKVEEPEKKPLIGRVGTNLRVGIVGVPNVGKSTFFNVLTKSQAAAENFPFCTIDPNENKYHSFIHI
ncbi:hypothetical protein MSG28_003532 [Choristoneura fumiferana]|uniref:Uncharacterized protein n=1 Tax=Choristoneura fumiferana TaxID=7141 RepID=A0ACC0KFT1_CHOFU|nr:hypothetical protein MSG28_003532 [Choristoneura fumiferana]